MGMTDDKETPVPRSRDQWNQVRDDDYCCGCSIHAVPFFLALCYRAYMFRAI